MENEILVSADESMFAYNFQKIKSGLVKFSLRKRCDDSEKTAQYLDYYFKDETKQVMSEELLKITFTKRFFITGQISAEKKEDEEDTIFSGQVEECVFKQRTIEALSEKALGQLSSYKIMLKDCFGMSAKLDSLEKAIVCENGIHFKYILFKSKEK